MAAEYQIRVLRDCMREAFIYYFDDDLKDTAAKIRLDAFAWSPDYQPNSQLTLVDDTKVPANNLYLDKRSIRDYEAFSKYFTNEYSGFF